MPSGSGRSFYKSFAGGCDAPGRGGKYNFTSQNIISHTLSNSRNTLVTLKISIWKSSLSKNKREYVLIE